MAQIVTTSSRKKGGNSKAFLFVLLALVVITAAVCVFKAAPKPRLAETPEPANPASTAVSNAVTVVESPLMPEAFPENAADSAAVTNAYVKKPGQMMLPNGKILTFKPPKEGEIRMVYALNAIYECDSEGNWKDVTPKKLFDNPLENQLVGLSVENGSFIPAFMMGYSPETVNEVLHRDVVINGDDPPDVVAKKEAVAEMKGIILDYIDQGGTFEGFVTEMATYVRSERRIKGRAISRIVKLVKSGDLEGARAYRDEFNQVLDQQEYSPLRLPKLVEEALGSDQ